MRKAQHDCPTFATNCRSEQCHFGNHIRKACLESIGAPSHFRGAGVHYQLAVSPAGAESERCATDSGNGNPMGDFCATLMLIRPSRLTARDAWRTAASSHGQNVESTWLRPLRRSAPRGISSAPWVTIGCFCRVRLEEREVSSQ